MSKLLIAESPLVILPTLAKLIGINEAIILQQIHYWISNPLNRNIRDGKIWVYNTYEDWLEQFPWWCKETIARTIRSLEKQKVLISSSKHNKHVRDQTKWYTIDYNHLESLDVCTEQQIVALHRNKLLSSIATNCSDVLPETTSEITTDIKTTNVELGEFSDKEKNSSELNSKINHIFEFWKTTLNHPNAKMDKKRNSRIQSALEIYSVEQIEKAIIGCSKSPFHMGDNEKGTIHDDIELICRDSTHIERFIAIFDNPPIPKPQGNQSAAVKASNSLQVTKNVWSKLPRFKSQNDGLEYAPI
jgi:hypothetical protein